MLKKKLQITEFNFFFFKVIFKFKSQLNLSKNIIKLGGKFLFPICLDYIGSIVADFIFVVFTQAHFQKISKIFGPYVFPCNEGIPSFIRITIYTYFGYLWLHSCVTKLYFSCKNGSWNSNLESYLQYVWSKYYTAYIRVGEYSGLRRKKTFRQLFSFFSSIIPRYTRNLIGMPALFTQNIFDR